eukprot:Skav217353  [mRNA]  locus=scaffold4442:45670:52138:+ [translate_table: standard]
MPIPATANCVVESPELKALELFIDQKNSEILSRFDDLLKQQQSSNESNVSLPVPAPLSNDNAAIKPRNSYDKAKADNSLRRQPFYGEPQPRKEPPVDRKNEDVVKIGSRIWKLEIFFSVVIISNAVLLGVQTEWAARNFTTEEPLAFTLIQTAYAVLFVVEIMWRISLSGCKAYLCSNDWAWHLLDVVVTISAVFDVLASFLGFATAMGGSRGSGFRLLRVMKIARLVRAIRIVKALEASSPRWEVLRFIRALRVLVFSIIHTMRSLVWSLVLLFVIMYSFGILLLRLEEIEHQLLWIFLGTLRTLKR